MKILDNKTLKNTPISVDFGAIMVVYKSTEGYWKGFTQPFDVTIEGNTKKEALKKLKESTDTYINELKRFGFPSHLVNKSQSDLEDREVFNKVVRNAIHKKGVIDSSDYHAETYEV